MDRESVSFFLDSEQLGNYEPLSIQRVTTDILCGDFDAHLDILLATIARRKHVLSVAPKNRRLILRRQNSFVLKRTEGANSLGASKKPQRSTEAKASRRTSLIA